MIQTASSLSFSSDLVRGVRGVHALAKVERRSRETREMRAAASLVSRLQSRAWLFACLGRFARLKTARSLSVIASLKVFGVRTDIGSKSQDFFQTQGYQMGDQ